VIRRFGFRGTALVIIGTIWVGIGFSITGEPDRPPLLLMELLPDWLRIFLWLGSGTLAVALGLTKGNDAIGWVALYLMPAVRIASYSFGTVDYFATTVGGPGLERGWLYALVWIAVISLIVVCAKWPEPPPGVPHDDE
jgi:hypothetical protein